MRQTIRLITAALFLAGFVAVYAQNPGTPQKQQSQSTQTRSGTTPQDRAPSAGADVGHGAGDVGKGAGGAAGNTAKGAGDLVTLHPAGAGKDLGKGGKDLGVGATKGTGKIAKGTGRGVGHLFHHHHKHTDPDTTPQEP